MKHDSVPQGRLKVAQEGVAAYFQPDLSKLEFSEG
jgi:hypothetical protein